MPAAMLFLASSTLGALSTAKKPGSSPTLYKTWVSTPSRIRFQVAGSSRHPRCSYHEKHAHLLQAAFLNLS